MPASCGQYVWTRVSGGLLAIKVTTRPMNTGMVVSISATAKPAMNSPTRSHRTWRA